jgi:uncharacterized protein YndB with AHSA1/START domain
MGSMDRARTRQEVVHARALGDDQLRNRPSPGGIFRTVMRGPEGQEINNIGCFLEIIPSHKLVCTVALRPGYRPADPSFDVAAFTAIVRMEPHGTGTKYSALAMHKDEASRNRHERMGFSEGWGRSLDQLVAHAKTMQAARGPGS